MNSISWPKIFKGNSTKVETNDIATKNCIHLLLTTEVGELFGDPEFGLRLKRYTFEQNNYILKDILIDEIYSQLVTFCPQIVIERKNISLTNEGSRIYVNIVCKNKLDFATNTYNLILFQNDEEE